MLQWILIGGIGIGQEKVFLGLLAEQQVSCLLPFGEGLSQLTGLSVSAESGHLVPSCDRSHTLLVFL